jgi:hypothetical protein
MVKWLYDLPRLGRIAFVSLVALSSVLAIFALVDRVYIMFFFNQATIILPSFFMIGLGSAMYIWGWLILVGTRNTKIEVHKSFQLYLLIAIIGFIVNVVLLIHGFTLTDIFAG